MEQTLPTGDQVVTKPEVKKLSQKEAVRKYVLETLSEMNMSLTETTKVLLRSKKSELQGDDKTLAKDIKAKVRGKLLEGLKSGFVNLKSEAKAAAKPNKYCSGLVNNWLSKDDFYK